MKVHFPKCEVIPRTDLYPRGADATVMTLPVDGFSSMCFSASPKGRTESSPSRWKTRACIGVRLTYENENLPVLVQWKSMRSGDYALGIEPANTFNGTAQREEERTLKRIKAGQSPTFRLRWSATICNIARRVWVVRRAAYFAQKAFVFCIISPLTKNKKGLHCNRQFVNMRKGCVDMQWIVPAIIGGVLIILLWGISAYNNL